MKYLKMDDKKEINKLIRESEHKGTFFIPPPIPQLKTKTWNKYMMNNGKILITYHYGTELMSARIHDDEDGVKEQLPEASWNIYRLPLLP